MFFLIEYDRPEGRLLEVRVYGDEERSKAEDMRLCLELDLNRRNVEREVVLLQAETEEDVRKTHRRYFETLEQLSRMPVA